jgi:hypothetical protein
LRGPAGIPSIPVENFHGVSIMIDSDLKDIKAIIERTKDQIYRLKQQLVESSDPGEKRKLKRRLRQTQIMQLKYLNKLG